MWNTDLSYDEQIVIDTGTETYLLMPAGTGNDLIMQSETRGASEISPRADVPTPLPGDVELSLSHRAARFPNQVRIVLKAPKAVTFDKQKQPLTSN